MNFIKTISKVVSENIDILIGLVWMIMFVLFRSLPYPINLIVSGAIVVPLLLFGFISKITNKNTKNKKFKNHKITNSQNHKFCDSENCDIQEDK